MNKENILIKFMTWGPSLVVQWLIPHSQCKGPRFDPWPGEGNGTQLQYSCLENPMDGGAWWATVHGVAKSRARLSDFTFTFHFRALEKEMATHSSVLAWRIPGNGEPGGLPSMGSHRVGHDWSDLAEAVMLSILIYILEVWGYKYYWESYLPQILYSLVEKLGQTKFMNQSSWVASFLTMRSLRDINDGIK